LTPIVVVPAPVGPLPLAPAPQITSNADVRAPRARVAATGRSLKNLVRGGLVVPVTCDETCLVRSRLVVAPRLARGLGISKIIGTSSAVSGLSGRRALTWIRLSPAAKRALRARRALRATLSITLTDDAGNTRVQRRSLVLR
jgi:hypothetical protein